MPGNKNQTQLTRIEALSSNGNKIRLGLRDKEAQMEPSHFPKPEKRTGLAESIYEIFAREVGFIETSKEKFSSVGVRNLGFCHGEFNPSLRLC